MGWIRSTVLTGRDLFDDVVRCSEHAAFWWLGQHTFVVKLGDAVLLFDPFLSDVEGRRVPPLFQPEDAAGVVDLVLCTHDHLDHIDPEAIPGLAEKTSAYFVAPAAHEERMLSLGVPGHRLALLNDDRSVDIAGVRVFGVKGAHEFFDETETGLFPFLGYVVDGAGKVVYHAGDTVWWEGLQARLRRWRFNLVVVPINGRDAERFERGILGNMTYQEAADLAGGLAVDLIVPAHYDMFDFNSEDPQLFANYVKAKYPGRSVWMGGYGEKVPF